MTRHRRNVILVVVLGGVALLAAMSVALYVTFRSHSGVAKTDPDQAAFHLNTSKLPAASNKSLDEASRAVTAWMRDVSGVRDQLGTEAEEVFRQVDQAGAAAVEKMVAGLRTGSKSMDQLSRLSSDPLSINTPLKAKE